MATYGGFSKLETALSRRRAKLGWPTECAHRRRPIRSLVAAVSLLAFILSMLLATVPMQPPGVAGNVILMPICTGDGIKWMILDPEAPDSSNKPSPSCPSCLTHIPGLIVAVADAPWMPAMTGAELPFFHRDAPILRIAARPPPGRGPPFLSSSQTLHSSL